MDEVVKLDRKSFEALAGKTRVRVLKALLERRKTLTELSEQLKFSPSTMKEHMKVLEDAGLVVQVDEGRKWKYYELTKMGERVARPVEIRAIVMLAASLFLLGAALLNMFSAVGPAAMVHGEMQYMAAPAMDASAEEAAGGARAAEYPVGGPEEPMVAPMAADAVEGEAAWDEEADAGAAETYAGTEDMGEAVPEADDGAMKSAENEVSYEEEFEAEPAEGLPLLEVAMVLGAALLAAIAVLNAREKGVF